MAMRVRHYAPSFRAAFIKGGINVYDSEEKKETPPQRVEYNAAAHSALVNAVWRGGVLLLCSLGFLSLSFLGDGLKPNDGWLYRTLGPEGVRVFSVGFGALCLVGALLFIRHYLVKYRAATAGDTQEYRLRRWKRTLAFVVIYILVIYGVYLMGWLDGIF